MRSIRLAITSHHFPSYSIMRRLPLSLALVLGCAVSAPLAAQPVKEAPAFVLEKDVMVAMRDGVKLSTDIYRPIQSDGSPVREKLPVILTRTPYNKTGA